MNTESKAGASVSSLLNRFKAAIGQSLESKAAAVLADGEALLAGCDHPATLREFAETLRQRGNEIGEIRMRERTVRSTARWEDGDEAETFAKHALFFAGRLQDKAQAIERSAAWRAQRDNEADTCSERVKAGELSCDESRRTMGAAFKALRVTRVTAAQFDEAIVKIDAQLAIKEPKLEAARDRAADDLLRATIEGGAISKPERLESLELEVQTLKGARAKAIAQRDDLRSRESPLMQVAKMHAANLARAEFEKRRAVIDAAMVEFRELFEEWAAWGSILGQGSPKESLVLAIDAKAAALRADALRPQVTP